jgi:hypothetical protein
MTFRRLLILLAVSSAAFAAAVTFPIWAMGPAVFLDAQRSVVARRPSPDGRRIAQIERLVVGGVPSIVITVRSWWMPNWYLAACAAASHYQDTDARLLWKSNDSLAVLTKGDIRFWAKGDAPFHRGQCTGLNTTIVPITPTA